MIDSCHQCLATLEKCIQPVTATRHIGRLEAEGMATVRQAVERDVFPTLGAFIGSGLIAGVLVSVVMTGLMEFGAERRLVHGALSAGLGAILGLFVGLGRGVWHFGGT